MSKLAQDYLEATYHVVKILKQSSKSTVELVTKDNDTNLYVRKSIYRDIPAYSQLAKFSHPLLPKIYGLNTDGKTTTILEEFINGQNLDDYITNNQFPEKDLKSVARQISNGLMVLHEHKILHRDIKPSNIIMLPDGTVKLIDFDAARLENSTESKDTKLLGTEGFAPPEQYGFAQTDERSDIYALGKTLKLLAGKNYNGPLASIIAKSTQLAPENRYQSAKEMYIAINRDKYTYFGKRMAIILGITGLLLLAFIFYYKITNHITSNQLESHTPKDFLEKATSFTDLLGIQKEQVPVPDNGINPSDVVPPPIVENGLEQYGFPTAKKMNPSSSLPLEKKVGMNGEAISSSQLAQVLNVSFNVNGMSIPATAAREVGVKMKVTQNGSKRAFVPGQTVSVQIDNNSSRPLTIHSVAILLGNMNYIGTVGGDLSLKEQGRFPGKYMLSTGALQKTLPANSTWTIALSPNGTQLSGGIPYLKVTLSGSKFEEYTYVLKLL